ncbi:hypothetical protein EYF80_054263 [Liparis tanakae]|uniref:Uncharacterized protein n=1 Tax=Liparis tanakae TaxID=230148 RepID=A0A4Z2F2W5_9TELE|nr:hypothetical protein EYF80_054263 [Liparis tanakae]
MLGDARKRDDLEYSEGGGDSSSSRVVVGRDLRPDTTWGPYPGVLQSEASADDRETEKKKKKKKNATRYGTFLKGTGESRGELPGEAHVGGATGQQVEAIGQQVEAIGQQVEAIGPHGTLLSCALDASVVIEPSTRSSCGCLSCDIMTAAVRQPGRERGGMDGEKENSK